LSPAISGSTRSAASAKLSLKAPAKLTNRSLAGVNDREALLAMRGDFRHETPDCPFVYRSSTNFSAAHTPVTAEAIFLVEELVLCDDQSGAAGHDLLNTRRMTVLNSMAFYDVPFQRPQEQASSLMCPFGFWRHRRWAVWSISGLLAVVIGIVLWNRWPGAQKPVSAVASQDDEFDDQVAPDPGYVGPKICARCHAARVAEFESTRHYKACATPQATGMAPGFAAGRGILVKRELPVRFEMTRGDNGFFQTAVQTTAAGEQRTTALISLVYGAGGNGDEVYFTWRGDRLYELPMAWLHPQNRWGVVTLNQYSGGDFSRPTTPRCLECHNTWFDSIAASTNQYRPDRSILGVTCERCHGPGSEHVAFHQANPDADAGQAILHPRRLPRERQLELCAQCHSNAVKYRRPPFSYRPGERLDASYKTLTTKYPEQDHVTNQVKYLRQSKCFEKSDTLTCLTCHDPHRPTNKDKVGQACLKCHRPADCSEQDRLPAPVRGNCVGCHMPPRYWVNVHFHTEDDQYLPPMRRHEHRIAVYAMARQEVLLAWRHTQTDSTCREEASHLSKTLVEHWLAEADKRRRDFRFLAASGALREALQVEWTPVIEARLKESLAVLAVLDADLATANHLMDQRRYAEATEAFLKVLEVKPDLATAQGRLGTLHAIAGQRELAVERLHAVVRYDPDDPYGYAMLGWLAYLDGRMEEAVDCYRQAQEIEPFDAKINYQWGQVLLALHRLPESAERFQKVLLIDPNHAGGSQRLSQVLRLQGQAAEAVRYARRAARLTRFENPDILLTLAEAYAEAGRGADARDVAAKALEAAERANPQLVPQIRKRIDELHERAAVAR
jgi:tetratricopeptide (TPR) repeat protein